MTLTKKHFVAIADILYQNHMIYHNKQVILLDLLINDLSDYFKTIQPKFDEQKFKEIVLKGVEK